MSSRQFVQYGAHTLEFTVERRDRATLDIAVMPNGAVEVTAPVDASVDEILLRVRKRARWVLAQQRYFAQFAPRTTARQWVPGESHLYLGRQYRLRIGEPSASARRVRLVRGFLLFDGVEFDDSATIERMLHAWYREHAAAVFSRRLPICLERFGESSVPPDSVRLREMRTRWGSMSTNGCLSLNPDLVRAPVNAIDYVITHELAHRLQPNHSRAFWSLLDRVMPDHEMRKLRLERALS